AAENIGEVSLMKINIEGGEYDLLENLIATGLISRIRDIQVQFHMDIPDAERRMHAIQSRLAGTHRLTFQYPFVWENWQRRPDAARAHRPRTGRRKDRGGSRTAPDRHAHPCREIRYAGRSLAVAAADAGWRRSVRRHPFRVRSRLPGVRLPGRVQSAAARL